MKNSLQTPSKNNPPNYKQKNVYNYTQLIKILIFAPAFVQADRHLT